MGLKTECCMTINPGRPLRSPHAGFEVLTAMEKVPTDEDDRPKKEIKITGATVFVNPYKDEEEAERKAAEEARLKVAATRNWVLSSEQSRGMIRRPSLGPLGFGDKEMATVVWRTELGLSMHHPLHVVSYMLGASCIALLNIRSKLSKLPSTG